MYRYYLTNKWVLSAIGFLIVLSVACVLWYKHDTSADRQAATDAENQLRQMETPQTAASNTVTKDVTKAPAESTAPTAEKPITQITDKVVESSTLSAESSPNLTQKTQNNEKTATVSPHGFGPYPELPSDFPSQDLWDYPDYMDADSELMLRVTVKLWKQGIRTVGSIIADGLVYPTIPGTVYIEWKNKVNSDGTVERVASAIRGDPYMGQILSGIERQKGRLVESDIPSDIEVKEGGIDPYEFLNLNK